MVIEDVDLALVQYGYPLCQLPLFIRQGNDENSFEDAQAQLFKGQPPTGSADGATLPE
jgi:hypothetical protein